MRRIPVQKCLSFGFRGAQDGYRVLRILTEKKNKWLSCYINREEETETHAADSGKFRV
jgi:hypothetical protein